MTSHPQSSEEVSLERLKKMVTAGYSVTIPWPNKPSTTPYPLRLGTSFHPESITADLKAAIDPSQITSLSPESRKLFDTSQAAFEKSGTWPFYGPSPLDTSGKTNIEVLLGQSSASWNEIRSVMSGVSSKYICGGLGIGVGCEFCGASVMVEYEKEMAEKRNSSKVSAVSRIVHSTVRFQQMPSLTESAEKLLQDGGPALFKSVYGTHFLSGIILGNEIGYSFAKESSESQEKEDIKMVMEVHALFWSETHEEQLAAWEKSRSSVGMTIVFYDTATQTLEAKHSADITPEQFVAMSEEVKQQLDSQVSRTISVVEDVRDKALEDVSGSKYILAFVLSPWQILHGSNGLLG